MDFDKYTERTRRFLQSAQVCAQREEHQSVGSDHLLKALLSDPEGLAAGLILRAGGKPDEVIAAVDAALQKRGKASGNPAAQLYLDSTLAHVLDIAEKSAEKAGDSYVTSERLLLALTIETNSETGRILANAGVTPHNLEAVIRILRRGPVVDNTTTDANYEAVNKYTQDLTKLAEDGELDPVYGRDNEIRRAIEALSRGRKNNPILVGEPGVGKTAIVNALAQRMAAGDVPVDLQHKKLLALNLGALIAGSKYRGEFEERLKAVLDELKSSDGACILLIDGMHTLIGGGRSQSANEAAALLKPAIDSAELRFVGTTTPDGFKTYIESDEALARRTLPIFIAEPSVRDTISILRTVKERYERHHRVRISDGALVAAATLSERYRYSANRLPDKAIDLIDAAAARLKMQLDTKPEELDALEREISRIKIDHQALRTEQDPAARARIKALDTEIEALEMQFAELTLRWRLEAADSGAASEASREMVTPYHVANVVSRETGIPVDEVLNEGTEVDQKRNPEQPVPSGKVFISYRRDDVAGHAGRIHDRLRTVFGADLVFMDVDSIPFGSDFVKALHDSVGHCEVLLALIGPNWLDAQDGRGKRRLDDPNDFVRMEIATALDRNIHVIPILLPSTSMPRPDQLPEDLRGLAQRQALEVRHVSFQSDIDKLIDALKRRRGLSMQRRPLNS